MRLDPRYREAANLEAIAYRDDRAVELGRLHGAEFETIGFHLQQSVEKRLKAIILLKGETPDRTHNIDALLDRLAELGMDTDVLRQAALLNDFAVRLRYESGDESDEASLELGGVAAQAVAKVLLQTYESLGFSAPGSMPFPEQIDPKVVQGYQPCPCGSGLKFKSCHYGRLRSKGVI